MYRIIETQTGKPITTDSVAFTPAGKILVIKENSYEFADPAKFKLVEYPVPEKAQFCKLLKAMENLDKKQDKIYSVLQETCEDSALYLPSVKMISFHISPNVFMTKANGFGISSVIWIMELPGNLGWLLMMGRITVLKRMRNFMIS